MTHKKSEFTGLKIPFGARVLFKPSTTRPEDIPKKWEPDALEGVFAGCYFQPGYTWSKQYLVWPLTDFDGLKLNSSIPADEFPLREPHEFGRLVVPPGSWRFPLKARCDFVNGSLAGDSQRRERLCDPFACPPDAPPVGQNTLLSEAPNYAVENIPRFDEELEAAADDDDLFSKIVEEGPAADLGSGLPSGDEAPVGGDSATSCERLGHGGPGGRKRRAFVKEAAIAAASRCSCQCERPLRQASAPRQRRRNLR